MSTADHNSGVRSKQFGIDLETHGFEGPGFPSRADVELTADTNNTSVAVIEAGEFGRWSIDLFVDRGRVEITRAYEDGMRVDETELPNWMVPVRREIQQEVSKAQ